MKKRPYRLTGTGIRISKHKTKWMAPLKNETPECLDILPSANNASPNLFIHNLNLLLQIADGQETESTDIIDVTDNQGGEMDDV